MGNITTNQNGQSMVEYVVICAALTLAMFAPLNAYVFNSGANIGNQDGNIESLEDAVLDRQRGYTYALSLSAIPETDDYGDLADYYDELGKYPALAAEMHSADDALDEFVEGYTTASDAVRDIDPLSPPSASDIFSSIGRGFVDDFIDIF